MIFDRDLLQVYLPHQAPAALRSAGRAPGSAPRDAPASGPLDARPLTDRPKATNRDPQTPSVASVVELPSRPPPTQAEPSIRGPGRQGRSYSGALLDALNHARSTVCGSKADGMELGRVVG